MLLLLPAVGVIGSPGLRGLLGNCVSIVKFGFFGDVVFGSGIEDCSLIPSIFLSSEFSFDKAVLSFSKTSSCFLKIACSSLLSISSILRSAASSLVFNW